MTRLETLITRAEKAATKVKAAREAERKTRAAISGHGFDRFKIALAKRGIVPKETLVKIKGSKATSRKVFVPDVAGRVEFFHSPSPPNAHDPKWWFSVYLARQKKDGSFRNESLYCAAYGATPEDAAKMIVKWT